MKLLWFSKGLEVRLGVRGWATGGRSKYGHAVVTVLERYHVCIGSSREGEARIEGENIFLKRSFLG